MKPALPKEDRYYAFADALIANDAYDRYADRQNRYGEVKFASCQLYDAKTEEPEAAKNLVRSDQATCLRDSNRRTTPEAPNAS